MFTMSAREKQAAFSIIAVITHLLNAHLCFSIDQYQSSSHKSHFAIHESLPRDDIPKRRKKKTTIRVINLVG